MLLSASILFLLPFLVASTTVSIGNVPAYTTQRPCAQSCFGDNVNGAAWHIAERIGCDDITITNECVCRVDLQPSADAVLSSCVYTSCDQNTLDVNSAVSIYDAYCTGAGYLKDGAQATPTQPGSSSPASATSTTSPASSRSSQTSAVGNGSSTSSSATNASPTQISSSSSNGNSSGGNGNALNTGELVGIIVGVLGFLATAVGTYYAYKAVKKNSGQNGGRNEGSGGGGHYY